MSDLTVQEPSHQLPPGVFEAYLAFLPTLRRIGSSQGLRADQVDDLVQNVFVELAEGWHQVHSDLRGWLVRVTHRRISRERHCHQRLKVVSWNAGFEPAGPLDEMAPGLSHLEWQEFLDSLPDAARRMLKLRRIGVSRDCIPKTTGLTHSEVRELITLYKARFREWFA